MESRKSDFGSPSSATTSSCLVEEIQCGRVEYVHVCMCVCGGGTVCMMRGLVVCMCVESQEHGSKWPRNRKSNPPGSVNVSQCSGLGEAADKDMGGGFILG